MLRLTFLLFLTCLPLALRAEAPGTVARIAEEHIAPGFAALAHSAAGMAQAAQTDCEGTGLRAAHATAFLDWTRVSHLRFGPSEEDGRAYRLAYWPDPRGKTPAALGRLLTTGDDEALFPQRFAEASIAARGFHALERLLHDDRLRATGPEGRRCALIRAVADDIARTAQELDTAWQAYLPALVTPAPDAAYRSADEVRQVLYKSAVTGLQFTADLRLGRPLGKLDRPRPSRAEAWRAGLSLALLRAAVTGAGDLAERLAAGDAALQARIAARRAAFDTRAAALDDPALAGVATPEGRIRIEALGTELDALRRLVETELGAHLGVTTGFNALDGD